jgi:serine/threonine-protein kinase
MPFLLLKTADGRFAETPVPDSLVIGRSSTAGLRVEDDLVSRRHAEITRENGDYVLRDLGSSNGTQLNGMPITVTALAFGDEITLGRTRLLFVQDAPSALIGETVAGYQVLEQIGSGGMGIVFRARQLSLERTVALKVLHPRLVARPKFIERFLREARAAGALNHPNLVHVHDVGRWEETYYYAMDYVDGSTASEELRRHGPFRAERAVDVARQITAALAYAHTRGIVHRDVKPQNIMLARDGTAKLADLGLATPAQLEDPNRERQPDGKIRVWGSPSYMAPEVATGGAADPRSDLYALGATLFHLIAGRPPFLGMTPSDILKAHVGEPLPDLRELAAHPMPESFITAIDRLLAKRPADRYPVAEALLVDLERMLQDVRQAASEDDTRPVPDGDEAPSVLHRLLDHWFGSSSPDDNEDADAD